MSKRFLLATILFLFLYSTSAQDTGTNNKIRTAFNTPYVHFGGYGLLTAQYNDLSERLTAQPRFAFFSMNGKIYDNLRYFLLYEIKSATLTEFYAEWTPLEFLSLRAGQLKVPFSFENPISPTALESVYSTRTVSYLAGMNNDVGVQTSGRDIGIQLSGELLDAGNHKLIQYWAGLFQGTGINTMENNKTKDFSGTLAVQPAKGFRIAGSLYAGEANYTAIAIGDTLKSDHVRNRWALSTDYITPRFYLRAEWLNGNDAGIKKQGVYGTVLYYVLPSKLNFFAKADYFCNNKATGETAIDYTGGVNYYFAHLCRLQLNYTHSQFSSNWKTIEPQNTIAAQLQIVW